MSISYNIYVDLSADTRN